MFIGADVKSSLKGWCDSEIFTSIMRTGRARGFLRVQSVMRLLVRFTMTRASLSVLAQTFTSFAVS